MTFKLSITGMIDLSGDVRRTLFLFIDESGNFDFSIAGTRYFVMACISTLCPIHAVIPLHNLRYKLISEGLDLSYFHAAPDSLDVRDLVIKSIISTRGIFKTHVVYGEKALLNLELQSDSQMHGTFSLALIQDACEAYLRDEYDRIVIVFDQALPPAKQESIHARIKPALKSSGGRFHVFFQSMKSEMNGQIADYVAWAKFRQLERGDDGPWMMLSPSLKPTEQEIFGG